MSDKIYHFTCEVCGGEFHGLRSYEELEKEYKALWTEEERSEGFAVVCNDCFEIGMKNFRHRN